MKKLLRCWGVEAEDGTAVKVYASTELRAIGLATARLGEIPVRCWRIKDEDRGVEMGSAQSPERRAIDKIAEVTHWALDGKEMMSRVYVWIGSLAWAVKNGDLDAQERLYEEIEKR